MRPFFNHCEIEKLFGFMGVISLGKELVHKKSYQKELFIQCSTNNNKLGRDDSNLSRRGYGNNQQWV